MSRECQVSNIPCVALDTATFAAVQWCGQPVLTLTDTLELPWLPTFLLAA